MLLFIGIGIGIPLLRFLWQPYVTPPSGAPEGNGLLLEDESGYVQLENGIDFILVE